MNWSSFQHSRQECLRAVQMEGFYRREEVKQGSYSGREWIASGKVTFLWGMAGVFQADYLVLSRCCLDILLLLLLSCRISLYILDFNPLSDTWFSNIFFYSVSYLFIVLTVFWCTRDFNFCKVKFIKKNKIKYIPNYLKKFLEHLVSYLRNYCLI